MRSSRLTELIATSAVAACVVGMMLVIGGVIASGLFLPGVVVIGLGLIAFGAAAVLDVSRTGTGSRPMGREATGPEWLIGR